jgi:hypothetical protein
VASVQPQPTPRERAPWIDFEFTTDADGTKHAVNPYLAVSVLPDGEARLFHRRELKPFAAGGAVTRSALVAELDGVRVFIVGANIIVTKQNLPLGGG